MATYKQRVVTEHDELSDKVGKLTEFMFGPNNDFNTLDNKETRLLFGQLQSMIGYLDILDQRIRTFTPEGK